MERKNEISGFNMEIKMIDVTRMTVEGVPYTLYTISDMYFIKNASFEEYCLGVKKVYELKQQSEKEGWECKEDGILDFRCENKKNPKTERIIVFDVKNLSEYFRKQGGFSEKINPYNKRNIEHCIKNTP